MEQEELVKNTKSAYLEDTLNKEDMESTTTDQKTLKNENIGKLIYISSAFGILFLALVPAYSLAAQTYEQLNYQNLGTWNVMTMYISSAFYNSLAPMWINKFGFRKSFFIGGLSYSLIFLSGFATSLCKNSDSSLCNKFPIYSMNLIAFHICGLGAAFIWCAVGRYISLISNSSNNGFYFGVLNGFTNMFTLLSQGFSTLLFTYFDNKGFYFALCIVSSVNIILYGMVPQVKDNQSLLVETSELEEPQQKGLKQSLVEAFEGLQNKQYLRFLPMYFVCGLVTSFGASLTEKIIVLCLPPDLDEREQNRKTSIALLSYGFTQLVGSFVLGYLLDRLNIRMTSLFYTFMNVISGVLCYINLQNRNYAFSFIMCGVVGIADTLNHILLQSTVSKSFNGELVYYSIARIFSSIGAVIGFIFALVFKDKTEYTVYVYIIVVFISFVISPKDKKIKGKQEEL